MTSPQKMFARNINGWCEKDVEGNSMAGRFAILIDAKDDEKKIQTVRTKPLTVPLPLQTAILWFSNCPNRTLR